MTRKGVSKEDLVEAPKVHWQRIRTQQAWRAQEEALKEYGVDTFGALSVRQQWLSKGPLLLWGIRTEERCPGHAKGAEGCEDLPTAHSAPRREHLRDSFAPDTQVMARLLWKNLTPWLQEDVRKALERPDLDVFRRKPFVGLHVRRGDKVGEGEAQKVETKEYLSAAARFFDNKASQDKQDIEAIWVASDDHKVVEEVRAIARQYFPNVLDEDIVWVSGGARGGAVTTHTKSQGYQGFVMVFADLKMLAAGSLFVGTYTSNVSRLVALLREGIHGHARDSCISLDKTEFGLQY
ncbi:GT23 [Ectocarpus sp. CCAP 1310/34]|nr:GT23 [Ectocarpus sp. CCAP 1310/34]